MKLVVSLILVWLGCCVLVYGQRVIDPQDLANPDLTLKVDARALSIDFRVGFDDTLMKNQPNVVAFRLTNASDKLVTGNLEIEQISMVGRHVRYRHILGAHRVEVGQGSRQSLVFPLAGFVNDPSMVLRLKDEMGNIVWQRYHYCENPVQMRFQRLRVWSVTSKETVLEAGPVRASVVVRNGPRGVMPPAQGQRDIHLDRIPAWALPNDPFLLSLSNGVVLGKEALEKITRSQETALAHYVARGGVLLLPEASASFEDQLWSQLPFPKPSMDEPQAAVGLGVVVRYPPTALRSGERVANAWIYETLDRQPDRLLPAVYSDIQDPNRRHFRARDRRARGARASRSRNLCLLFAGLFTLVTGPVAWLFRKAPRRRFLWMLGSAVAIFCVLAILLGLSLNKRAGEMWWSSLTEISPQGGALQTAVLELESAGARSHTLRLVDPEVRFRRLDRMEAWPWRYPNATSTEHVEVPLLPWAREFLTAESYASDVKPIICRMAMSGSETVTISWDNPNAFKIQSVQVMLSSVDGRPVDAFYRGRPAKRGPTYDTLFGFMVDVEDQHQATMELSRRTPSAYMPGLKLGNQSDEKPLKQGAPMKLGPAYTLRSHYDGFVIFQVDRSPGMAIDEDDSDFVSSGELHYVLQFLTMDSLPPYDKLFTSKPYVASPAQSRSTFSRKTVIQQ